MTHKTLRLFLITSCLAPCVVSAQPNTASEQSRPPIMMPVDTTPSLFNALVPASGETAALPEVAAPPTVDAPVIATEETAAPESSVSAGPVRVGVVATMPAPVPAANLDPIFQTPPLDPRYVPYTLPNYAEVGIDYYKVTHDFGDTFGQFANVQYQSDPWNRWSFGVQHAEAFHDDGQAISFGNTHIFNENWYTDIGIGFGSSASFLTQYRVDADINRAWLPRRNFITTVGISWDQAAKIYEDKALLLSAAYYFQDPWVVQAGVKLNDSTPGDVFSPSGFAAVTYGKQKHYLITGRVGIAHEAYQLIGPAALQNAFNSESLGVTLRQWCGEDWGFNAGTELYHNPFYNRTGGVLSVFKEF